MSGVGDKRDGVTRHKQGEVFLTAKPLGSYDVLDAKSTKDLLPPINVLR